ncbi:MAG: hypothetical protein Q9169_002993 [Polycauliona sp. 2 TL-2023]
MPTMSSMNSKSSAHRETSLKQRYFEGWRAGAIMSCATALAVLIVNIAVTSWAVKNYPSANGIGTIFSGNCARAKSINTWLQIIVNVLSSTLLAASNYCMQCAGSPTRVEVDAAHARGKILDIGIPSIQNLRFIGFEHQPFLDTGYYSISSLDSNSDFKPDTDAIVNSASSIRTYFNETHRFQRLNPPDCRKAYSSQYMSSLGDVLIVSVVGTSWYVSETMLTG